MAEHKRSQVQHDQAGALEPAPPLVLTRQPSSVLPLARRIAADGWSLHAGFEVTTEHWSLHDAGIVCHGTVTTLATASTAALVAARGGGIVAGVPDAGILARLYDDLCRLGEPSVHNEPVVDLPPDLACAMDLLVNGASLAELATTLHWSRRTVNRRIAAARSALAAATTAEAVTRWRATTLNPALQENRPRLAQTRDERWRSSSYVEP